MLLIEQSREFIGGQRVDRIVYDQGRPSDAPTNQGAIKTFKNVPGTHKHYLHVAYSSPVVMFQDYSCYCAPILRMRTTADIFLLE